MSATDLPQSVLIVGSGGREHSLVRAIAASAARPRLLAAPGNPGIAEDGATCHAVKADDIPGLVALAKREAVDFVVVGPEVPLALGLVALAGAASAGPTLDAIKARGKLKCGVPTPSAGFAFPDSKGEMTELVG